jgi:hypothetical protein
LCCNEWPCRLRGPGRSALLHLGGSWCCGSEPRASEMGCGEAERNRAPRNPDPREAGGPRLHLWMPTVPPWAAWARIGRRGAHLGSGLSLAQERRHQGPSATQRLRQGARTAKSRCTLPALGELLPTRIARGTPARSRALVRALPAPCVPDRPIASRACQADAERVTCRRKARDDRRRGRCCSGLDRSSPVDLRDWSSCCSAGPVPPSRDLPARLLREGGG